MLAAFCAVFFFFFLFATLFIKIPFALYTRSRNSQPTTSTCACTCVCVLVFFFTCMCVCLVSDRCGNVYCCCLALCSPFWQFSFSLKNFIKIKKNGINKAKSTTSRCPRLPHMRKRCCLSSSAFYAQFVDSRRRRRRSSWKRGKSLKDAQSNKNVHAHTRRRPQCLPRPTLSTLGAGQHRLAGSGAYVAATPPPARAKL